MVRVRLGYPHLYVTLLTSLPGKVLVGVKKRCIPVPGKVRVTFTFAFKLKVKVKV